MSHLSIRRTPLAVRFLLPLLILVAGTDRMAHQDIASLFLKEPGVLDRARTFLLTNPFSTLRMATFSLPSPLGAAIPKLSVPNHFAVLNASLPGTAPVQAPSVTPQPAPALQRVDRSRKGNRLEVAALPVHTIPTLPAGSESADESSRNGAPDDPADTPITARADLAGTVARSTDSLPAAGSIGSVSQLFFGANSFELPPLAFDHRLRSPAEMLMLAALPGISLDDVGSVAAKGVVTGDGATLKSPAERLALSGQARAKAEKCLADAIYFESRGEPEHGQVAVAQVVINRVFSGYYPADVCGTVYQNAHRHLACQFTFACEGKKLAVNDQRSWERATRISRDMLDGKLWLAEVGKATHYHANWVSPWWTRDMRKIHAIGVHTFYRPHKWEDS